MVDLAFTESLDRLKESFLFAAAQGGNTEDCESLLEIGADTEWRNPEGDTPLLAATRRGHCDTIQTLLVHGANVNVTGKDSLTPLHICCNRGDYKALNILLQSRPSLTTRTVGGKTALEIAESKGFEDICSRLTTLLVTSGAGDGNTLWQQQQPSQLQGGSERESDSKKDRRRKKNDTSGVVEGSVNNGRSNINSRPSLTPLELPTSRKNSGGSAYQLMGQNHIPGHDETSIALRKQLDKEYQEKKALESKVAALQVHVTELRADNASNTLHVEELQEVNKSLNAQLDVLKGNNLDSLITVADCENMEAKLKHALSAVDKRKSRLLAQEIDKQKEDRLCVVCQEGEKSVVLFPCRHMCLCEMCSQHEDLQQCPLCRRPIVQRISVYS